MKKLLGLIILCLTVWVLVIFSLHYEPRKQHEPTCRLPDVGTEYRVLIQTRDNVGLVNESCHIVPRDPNEGRYETMQRLLKRERHKP